MLRSLYSGVSGLKTHQTKMDVIGNNIANVNTYGFKGSRVTFRDIYYQTLTGSANASTIMGGANATQLGYGTSVGSIDLIMSRSGFASTGQGMDCYIDGEGYFVVQDGNGNEKLTRVGTLSFDGSGNLVDGNKNFVSGYNLIDSSTKVMLGDTLVDFGEANAGMLDGYMIQLNYNIPGDEGVTINADGASKIVEINYTPPSSDPFKTFAKIELQEALTTAPWHWLDITTAPTSFDKYAISVDGANTWPTMLDAVLPSSNQALSTADFDYSSHPQRITNNLSLINCAIGPDGTITGQNTSGQIVIIGQIAIANVPNPQALVLEGNSYFKVVNNTGDVTYSTPGSNSLGTLVTGGLEMSNVDLTTEFSDMIMTQRGFQANSRIITVSDAMLEELVNLKR